MRDHSGKGIAKIPWEKSIWFFDIDDTLVNTAETSLDAAEGIREVFEAKFGSQKAIEVQNNFKEIFTLMMSGHQGAVDRTHRQYDELMQLIEGMQSGIIEKFGKPKKWSREIFTKIAADRAGLKVTPDIIEEAGNAYWMILTQKAKVYPGVVGLMQTIKNHKRPIYLVTGSDARFTMEQDGQFTYDPKISESFKKERIAILRQKGIPYNGLSVGDPQDKPHKEFFQKAFDFAKKDMGIPLDFKSSIFLGDSFAGDLEVPKAMGFALVVHFKNGMEGYEINDSTQITTGDISKVADFLS